MSGFLGGGGGGATVYSNPGAGSNSEVFGSGAASAGSSGVAVGKNASAAGANSVAVGGGAACDSSLSVAVGKSAEGFSSETTVIGYLATAYTYGVAVGSNAYAYTTSVALGSYANANANQAVCIGVSSSSGGHSDSIALGTGAVATASNQLMIGQTNASYTITSMTFGSPSGCKISNVADPTSAQDAATMNYVAFSGCRAYNSGAQSIPNNSNTALTFDSERFDVGGYHSTSSNTSRFVAPTDGYYHMGGQMIFTGSGSGNSKNLYIRLNGSTLIANSGFGSVLSGGIQINVDTVYKLTAGDYVEFVAFQDTGGSLNTIVANQQATEAWIYRIGR